LSGTTLNVSTKLEVSAAFSFRENYWNGTDGQTDRQTHDMIRRMRRNA